MRTQGAMTADRPRGWPRAAFIFLLAATLVAFLPAATGHAATTCSYDAGADTLNVGGDPNIGTQLTVFNQEIRVGHLSTGGVALVNCGPTAPTTTNTDDIVVEHTAPDEETVVLFFEIESFAPGATDESGGLFVCPSEIEIELDLGLGHDVVELFDSNNSADAIQFGNDGLDWDPGAGPICADADITTPDTVDYHVSASGGADTVSARGSDATGEPSGGEHVLDGGGGKDVLRGGQDDDRLTGGAGEDKLFGMAGLDGLFAEDGTRDPKLDCGGGLNSSEFAVRDGKDPKPKSC